MFAAHKLSSLVWIGLIVQDIDVSLFKFLFKLPLISHPFLLLRLLRLFCNALGLDHGAVLFINFAALVHFDLSDDIPLSAVLLILGGNVTD